MFKSEGFKIVEYIRHIVKIKSFRGEKFLQTGCVCGHIGGGGGGLFGGFGLGNWGSR